MEHTHSDKKEHLIFIILLTISALAIAQTLFSVSSNNIKVLFVGHYPEQVRSNFTQIIAHSPHEDTRVEFVSQFEESKQHPFSQFDLLEKIKHGGYDYVFLQEQSQQISLNNQQSKSFNLSVNTLSQVVRESGATPIIDMAWGGGESAQIHQERFPNDLTMQERLLTAYNKAAKNEAVLANVEQVWQKVWQDNPALAKELCKEYCSRPSDKGAFLVSMVFYKLLFNKTDVDFHFATMPAKEQRIIIDAVNSQVSIDTTNIGQAS